MTESELRKPRRPWWKNEWIVMIAVLAVLHATGMLVHVQAFVQRGVLWTGIFQAETIAEDERQPLPPGIAFRASDGETVALDDLAGEVLFVNLWASWCPPCLAEMPAIDRLHESHGDRVRFFAVSLDDNPATAFGHVERKGFGLPVYVPASRLPASVYDGVLPTTFVVDRQGRIAVHRAGMARYDSDGFRSALDDLATTGRPATGIHLIE